MSNFDWKGIMEESLDSTETLKLARGICGEVLVEDYAVYKKWINE